MNALAVRCELHCCMYIGVCRYLEMTTEWFHTFLFALSQIEFNMKNGTLLNILGYIILLVCSTSCSGDDALVNDGSHNTTDVAVTSNPTKVGVSFATIDGYVNLNLITANYFTGFYVNFQTSLYQCQLATTQI